MRRKKEDVAARTLQRAWRKHKAQQSIRRITEMAMEAKLNRSLTRTSFSMPSSGTSPRGTSPRNPSSQGSRPTSGSSSKGGLKSVMKRGNTLKVPTANEISLPSDQDLNV